MCDDSRIDGFYTDKPSIDDWAENVAPQATDPATVGPGKLKENARNIFYNRHVMCTMFDGPSIRYGKEGLNIDNTTI
jgi:hypothetical protein